MAHVLLTGANGQLGWEVAQRARGVGLSLRAADRGQLDVTDRQAVSEAVRAERPKVVINAAAYTAVDRAEADPTAAYSVNRDGSLHLAEACERFGAMLIHVSTDYVFDGCKDDAYREDDSPNPLGVYGASKLAGEEAIRGTVAQHVILRTSWVYGQHGRNFVKTMLRLGSERDRLEVVDDQRGCPTYAGDLADAVLAIARRRIQGDLSPGECDTFHCAGAGSTTWYGFALRIFALAEARLDRVPAVQATTTAKYPTAAKRPMNSVLDCSRLRHVHGLVLRPWEDALSEMLQAPEATRASKNAV